MNIIFKGTNLDLTEAIKQYAGEKIGALDHYMENIMEARVELEKTTRHHQSGEIFRCEVNLHVPIVGVLRADSTENDLYAAIDTVVPKLKERIDKFKGKHRTQDRRLARYLKTAFAWRPWRRGR